jgi:hypothetical protein
VTLENVQRVTNAQRVAAGRVSASNDPTQWQHDGREQLIKGAELAAAGRTLGMSEEETLAAVSRQYRRQRRADDRVTERDVMRQMVQAAATTTSDVGGGEIKGVRYEDDDELARAFGEDQSDYQNFRADDRGFTQDEETGLLRRETFDETRGESVDFAPQNAVRDALTELEAAAGKKDSLQQRLMGIFGGGNEREAAIARIRGRLEDDLRPDRGADAALGAEAVRRDNKRFDAEVREANDFRAAAEADNIARHGYTINGPGAFADENIGRIAEIKSLGKIGETAHVVRTANDAIKGQVTRRHDGVYLNPQTGDPVAVQGPELPAALVGDRIPNNGSSSDAINAPQSAQEWITLNKPDYREGGRTFGDYPQVDITRETTNFAQKLRELEGFGMQGVSANIRSVDELQRVIDHVGAVAQKQGKQLYRFDAETGKNRPSSAAGAAEVMNLLRMNEGDQQRLANALFQLDAAKRSSVNQNATGTYLSRTGEPTKDVIFNASEAMTDNSGQAEVARIPKGSTIRVGTDTQTGKPIRGTIVTELAGLDTEGAQKPFMGAVVGPDGKPEKPRVNRMRPGGMGEGNELMHNIRRQAVSRSRGKGIDEERVRQNQVKARLVEEREKRDSAQREARKEEIRRYTPANLRQRGRYS